MIVSVFRKLVVSDLHVSLKPSEIRMLVMLRMNRRIHGVHEENLPKHTCRNSRTLMPSIIFFWIPQHRSCPVLATPSLQKKISEFKALRNLKQRCRGIDCEKCQRKGATMFFRYVGCGRQNIAVIKVKLCRYFMTLRGK